VGKPVVKPIPVEVWQTSIDEHMPIGNENVYELAGQRPLIPSPDCMEISPELADELYDVGLKCSVISPADAPLPVFELDMYTDKNRSEIESWMQPEHPYRDDLYFFGLNLLYVANDKEVICQLTAHESNDSSGGETKLTVFSFGYLQDIMPLSTYEKASAFAGYEEIERLARWAVCLWRGIQYRFLHRPGLTRVYYNRLKSDDREVYRKNGAKNARVVKVQRIITLHPEAPICAPHAPSEGVRCMSCPCWGVIGHWRCCKNGKRVWIKPYRKGHERMNEASYSSKRYAFVEKEVLPDA